MCEIWGSVGGLVIGKRGIVAIRNSVPWNNVSCQIVVNNNLSIYLYVRAVDGPLLQ